MNKVFGFLSVFVLCAVLILGYFTLSSSYFTVRQIEVRGGALAQADPEKLKSSAGIALGSENLVFLNLGQIKKRLLLDSWIKDVALYKEFPSTLVIQIYQREPIAYVQTERGVLAFVDDEGVVFSEANFRFSKNLPIITGLPQDKGLIVKEIVRLIGFWNQKKLDNSQKISSIEWSSQHGLRAVITNQKSKEHYILHLGQNIDGQSDFLTSNIDYVLSYLSQRGVSTTHVFLTDDKKIVVKTTHGS